jgi:hypothetical protein
MRDPLRRVATALRAFLAGEIGAGVAGAAAIALAELVTLHSLRPGVIFPVLALFLGLGLVAGLVMLASEKLIDRYQLKPLPAAAVRALPALIALVPLGRHLFEGAMAATLPGAGSAEYWVPLLGLLLIWLAGWLSARWLAGVERLQRLPGVKHLGPRRRRAILLAILGGVLLVGELGNRRLYRSEYPQIHLFLVVFSCVLAAVMIRLAADGAPALSPRRRLIMRGATAAVVLIALAVALPHGLAGDADRWVTATRGNHARHLARLYRGLLDRDGDGFSAVLGGGDCDDGDPDRNPDERDLAGNGIDENCDGTDDPPVDRRPDEVQVKTLADWLKGPEVTAVREHARGANLMLLSVDALRADMLEPSADNKAAFPNLSALLAAARRFDRAFSPASGTDVALTCLVTGRFDPFVPLPTTLLEALQASGRVTHAIYPSETLRWVPATLLTRGLDAHDVVLSDKGEEDIGRYTTSAEITDKALAFVRARAADKSKPFVLWAHYFDVHEHSTIDDDDPALAAVGGDLGSVRGKYRALLSVIDRDIGRLVAELHADGLWDHTVIVFFADHGESLGEDPRLPDHHGMYVYNPLVHVPLAIRVPGLAPEVNHTSVSLIDVGPTVLDLFGLPPLAGADATSQLGHLADGAPPGIVDKKRPLVMNESDQWGVLVWPDKLLFRPGDNLLELYDVERDFAELDNRAEAEPDRVRELRGIYAEFPRPSFDRSRKGRRWRERQAQPPAHP